MTAREKKTALIGGGGHASSLLEFAADSIDGYIDREPQPELAAAHLGDDNAFLAACLPGDWDVHVAIVGGSGRSMAARRRIIDRYSGYRFATLIAPTAIVTSGSTVGEGSAVMHRAVINGAAIGRNCIINTGAIVEHACRLADNVFIGPGAVVCGGVTIGADSFIGAGATVRNCATIAAGVTVGIGAAVVGDLTEPGVYTGIPAKLRKS